MSGLGSGRAPRLVVLADGVVLPATDAFVVSNNHFAADRFRVSAVASLAPPGLIDGDGVMLDVQVWLDGAVTSLVQGAVDSLDYDPTSGRLHLSGRDLSASLLESRTQETFSNRTASEIVTILAGRHGLSADVTATTTPVGRYWQLEHDRLVLDQFARATTEWDLLVTLAQFEGFDLWVSGNALRFHPQQADETVPTALRAAATAAGPANVMCLELHRSLTLARDIVVTVKSWNNRQANAFVQTASKGRGFRALNYVYVVPNLSPDDARRLAQRKLAELSQHERVMVAEMPGDLFSAPRQAVRVEGTMTSFDQVYWIDRVERHLSVAHGFTQTLHARNSSE